jgi:hypothetical protein
MIVAGVAFFALAGATIWYAIARGSRATTFTEADFDGTYDELLAKGEIIGDDREAAREEFHAWRIRNEQVRRWEEGLSE